MVHRITDWEATERPRERLELQGAEALSMAELVAILIRTGTQGRNAVSLAQGLLEEVGGLAGLQRTSYAELRQSPGVGPAKAAQIKAAVELGRRMSRPSTEDRPFIHSPSEAADLVRYEMGALEQEELRVLLLDTRNRLQQEVVVYRGSLNMSWIRVGEVFRDAVRANAASVIIVHNHPSGDPTPSPEDIAVTRAMVQAGRLLDIEVLDHVVVGRSGFVSLKAKGLGFEEGR